MAKTVLKFEIDAEKHYSLATEALEEGNLFSALKSINEARRLDYFNPEYRALAGDIYFEMELYERALSIDMTIFALVWSLEKPSFDIVYGCLRSFLKLDADSTSLAYLDIAFQECVDFSPEIVASFGDIDALIQKSAAQSDLHLVDSNEEDERAIAYACLMMRQESYDQAKEFLADIEIDSKSYRLASVMRAECEFFCEHVELSKDMVNAMLKTQADDYLVLSEAVYLFCMMNQQKEAQSLCARLYDYNGKDLEILRRIARACAYCGDFAQSLSRIDECLSVHPYDTDLLLMRAMATSNLKNITAAQDALLMVLTIDPYDTFAVYHNECLQNGTLIPANPFELPHTEVLRRLRLVVDLSTMDREVYLKECEKSYNIALIRWAILNDYLPEEEEFDILLALSEAPQCEFLYRELAAERAIPFKIRNMIVAVMIYSWSSDICVCVNDVIRKVDCKLPPNARKNEVYFQAWAFALASLSRCAIGFEKTLRSLFNKLIRSGYVPDCTAKELAAVLISFVMTECASSIEVLTTAGLMVGLGLQVEDLQNIVKKLLPAFFRAGIINEE